MCTRASRRAISLFRGEKQKIRCFSEFSIIIIDFIVVEIVKETSYSQNSLLSFYNASFGGRYELAGKIKDLEILTREGWVSCAECRKDPLSTHGASSCRIILTRMTKKGISEAKQKADDKVEVIVDFLNSLESHPPRTINIYRFLMKKWLKAIKNREEFDWKLKNRNAKFWRIVKLPDVVTNLISDLNSNLVSKGLATYASLHHNTSGPSSQTLVTCPEICEMLFRGVGWKTPGARGVQHVDLDEYLKYLLNGFNMVYAMDHMMGFFAANHYRINEWVIKWLSSEYGVSEGSLLYFLEDLADSKYITILSEEERQKENDIARGNPYDYFSSTMRDKDIIEDEVSKKIAKWIETGEETFQRFEFKKSH
jgi:hypothetical protein